MQTGIRSALRHGDGCAHIHARVDGVEWGIGSKRIATNVAEYLVCGIFFFQYLGQHRVHVAMAAPFAQGGRAHLYQRRNTELSLVLLAYGTRHAVRVQFSVLRQGTVQAAFYVDADAQITFQLFFYEGLPVFQYQNLVTRLYQLHQLFLGQRILSDFQYRIFATFGIVLHQVVVADAACHDAQFFVGTVGVFVVSGVFRSFDKFVLALQQCFVAFTCITRQKDELTRVVAEGNLILRLLFLALYAGAGVGQACNHAHQDGLAGLFGEAESVVRHVVGFLLVAWLVHRDEGEVAIETAVLLVL